MMMMMARVFSFNSSYFNISSSSYSMTYWVNEVSEWERFMGPPKLKIKQHFYTLQKKIKVSTSRFFVSYREIFFLIVVCVVRAQLTEKNIQLRNHLIMWAELERKREERRNFNTFLFQHFSHFINSLIVVFWESLETIFRFHHISLQKWEVKINSNDDDDDEGRRRRRFF